MIRRTMIMSVLLAALLASTAHATGGAAYLATRQTRSGGFSEPGGPASVSLTEWAVMGLAAAGRHPADMHRSGGHRPGAFLAGHAKGWSNAFSLERGILAVVALGNNPSSFAGRNLVSALRSRIGARGRIGRFLNSTYWGVLALRAAGSRVPSRSIDYIRSRAGSSGGFGYAGGAGADSNDTAAAVLALRAGGVPCNWAVITRAYAYMHSLQSGSDHGYALGPSNGSDSQSTSWVVQSRIRCGLSNKGALDYLSARRQANGSYAYRAGLVQTPAWVTSQVLPAVNGRAYPIR
jgi:hypothetical protein